jgi:sulfite exporter TauE/SafE
MAKRSVGGMIVFIVGAILTIIGLIVSREARISFLIYGIPLIAIGLFIYFNSGEDKIEEINYSKVKGGQKKK